MRCIFFAFALWLSAKKDAASIVNALVRDTFKVMLNLFQHLT
jgi:hypothetical protein